MTLKSLQQILAEIESRQGLKNTGNGPKTQTAMPVETSNNLSHSTKGAGMTSKNSGVVNIRGKEYQTVALRIHTFRETHYDWSIVTEVVHRDESSVVMKASILDETGRVRGTGYAEESRTSSQINRTSALENCETSAIGRALAACGFGGTEYASADEVQNAIHQQRSTAVAQVVVEEENLRVDESRLTDYLLSITEGLARDDDPGVFEVWDEMDNDMKTVAWTRLDSKTRARIKKIVAAQKATA